MLTRTSFIPLDVLFNCVLLCLMFLCFMVHCAAYAAWTTLGLVQTNKTCVKLTCLYQVQIFFNSETQGLAGTTFSMMHLISGLFCLRILIFV